MSVRVPLGWLGLAGMVSCGMVLQVTRSFPGYLALWPLLSAAAILAAGHTKHPLAVDRLLTWRPLMRLGDAAYALYLVHWPILVLWLAATDRSRVGILDGAVIIAASIALAALLSRAVEMPLRRTAWPEKAPRRSVALLVAIVLVVVGGSAVALTRLDGDSRAANAVVAGQAVASHPGARALDPGAAQPPALPLDQVIPPATALRSEFASLPMECEGRYAAAKELGCSRFEPVDAARKTVLVVGDSHAEQWLPAVVGVARTEQWRVVALLMGACSFGDASSRKGECADFNRDAMAYLERVDPDVLVTVSTAAHRTTAAEHLVTGYREGVAKVTARGIPVLGLRDNPRFTFGVASCALKDGLDAPACSAPVGRKLAATSPAATMAGTTGYGDVDLTDRICPHGQCVPVVGNIWVYLDDNHLTRTYAATLTDELGRRWRTTPAWPG